MDWAKGFVTTQRPNLSTQSYTLPCEVWSARKISDSDVCLVVISDWSDVNPLPAVRTGAVCADRVLCSSSVEKNLFRLGYNHDCVHVVRKGVPGRGFESHDGLRGGEESSCIIPQDFQNLSPTSSAIS